MKKIISIFLFFICAILNAESFSDTNQTVKNQETNSTTIIDSYYYYY